MADNVTVSNTPLTNYDVRGTAVTGGQIQHVRVDVGEGTTESLASGSLPATLSDVYASLRAILSALVRPLWSDPRGYLKVIQDVNSTMQVGTVTSVTAVANITNIGGQEAGGQLMTPIGRASWALCIRGRIS